MYFDYRKSKIDFVKHRKKFYMLTAGFIVVVIISFFVFGFNLGIDFVSGSKVEVLSNSSLTAEEIAADFAEIDLAPDDILLAGDNRERAYATFVGVLSQDEDIAIQRHFKAKYGIEPTINTVEPTVGRELAKNAFYSLIFAMIGIVIYVSVRFEAFYGIAAIIALMHDVFIILMLFSLLQMEITVTFIAAVLTIIGYSINDKIVTFDRIRENLKFETKIKGYDDLAHIVNKSLIQTLTRSINTSFTTVIAAIALLIFGGEGIRIFSFAIVVGLIAGTYSSIFLAAQLWFDFQLKRLPKKRLKTAKNEV